MDNTCHRLWVCTSWAVDGTDRSRSCGHQLGNRRGSPSCRLVWGLYTVPPLWRHTDSMFLPKMNRAEHIEASIPSPRLPTFHRYQFPLYYSIRNGSKSSFMLFHGYHNLTPCFDTNTQNKDQLWKTTSEVYFTWVLKSKQADETEWSFPWNLLLLVTSNYWLTTYW